MSFFKARLKFFKQRGHKDCGPSCLKMVASFYGINLEIDTLNVQADLDATGTTFYGLIRAAEQNGFNAEAYKLHVGELFSQIPLPCVVPWEGEHFVVIYKIDKIRKVLYVADPAVGLLVYSLKEFLTYWINDDFKLDSSEGFVLKLLPNSSINRYKNEKRHSSLSVYLKRLFFSEFSLFAILILSILLLSLLQLLVPFFTKSIIDEGFRTKDFKLITILIGGQFMLLLGRTSFDFIRSRVLLALSINIGIAMQSDFWNKLMKVPLGFFEKYHTGDLLQRLKDNKKIEFFLTGSSVSTIFSFFTFLVFSVYLAKKNSLLYFYFLSGSIIYFFWVRLFLKSRRKLNYDLFKCTSRDNDLSLQIISGIQDLRLYGAEEKMRQKWGKLQIKIGQLSFKTINYNQFQQSGSILINESKNLLLLYTLGQQVVNGNLSIGSMLAFQYIIGQLNSPIESFVSFIQSAQDAKIALERLSEVQNSTDEELGSVRYQNEICHSGSIRFINVGFSYEETQIDKTLNGVSFEIPRNKVTAIIGLSGSGKTTLLKLLLKVYPNYTGSIKIGTTDFSVVSPSFWRSKCAAVMHESYLFTESIQRNITLGGEYNEDKLIRAAQIANIHSFILTLPSGYDTIIGKNGLGISQGQRQRILIARAMYINPSFIFFDEATNSLDSKNEFEVIENICNASEGRTLVLVAHRLSTIRKAHHIVVMENGYSIEEGSHEKLMESKGRYYSLILSQMDSCSEPSEYEVS